MKNRVIGPSGDWVIETPICVPEAIYEYAVLEAHNHPWLKTTTLVETGHGIAVNRGLYRCHVSLNLLTNKAVR